MNSASVGDEAAALSYDFLQPDTAQGEPIEVKEGRHDVDSVGDAGDCRVEHIADGNGAVDAARGGGAGAGNGGAAGATGDSDIEKAGAGRAGAAGNGGAVSADGLRDVIGAGDAAMPVDSVLYPGLSSPSRNVGQACSGKR